MKNQGRWDAIRSGIVGHKFGRLTVLRFSRTNGRRSFFECSCSCGIEIVAALDKIKGGGILSCGCARKKHKANGTKIYYVWRGIKKRCENPSEPGYKNYGGRGIKVCSRWASFENFYEDMGDAPDGMSIDRIDVNGDYEPGNCRWATRVTQQNNTRANRMIEYDGRRMTLAEWARESGLPYHVVRKRLNKGWEISSALTTPKSEAHSHARI
jgi:hypothetical protein